MPVTQSSMIMVFVISLMQQLTTLVFDDDDDAIFSDKQYMQIGNVKAKDIYSDIQGTAYFRHYANCNEQMYDYIDSEMDSKISTPRNIHFRHTKEENAARTRRKCKISNKNRILDFLHTTGEQTKVWDSAFANGWNPSSASRDYKHILINFVETFGDEWIRELDDNQKIEAQVYENYPTVYSSIDGSMFKRRATHILPDHISRKDYYDHKSKHPESQNVQAIATKSNICTHLTTGIPGRMCDANASRYIAQNEWDNSILSDSGYNGNDRRFIASDGTMEHKQARAHVEHLFADVKINYAMVGGIYRRDSRFHSLAIRAAFILANMKKVFHSNEEFY